MCVCVCACACACACACVCVVCVCCADRELEVLRVARVHQDEALQQTRAQLRARETDQREEREGAKVGTHPVQRRRLHTPK